MANLIPTTPKAKTKTEYELIKGDRYPARLTRIVGLGMQPQPEWKGEKKDPAFKVALTFELYNPEDCSPLVVNGVTAEGEKVTRPACVFQDMFFFPGAKRGKVFDLCSAIQAGIESVPSDFNWFVDRLGSPVNLEVEQWTSKKDPTKKGVSVKGVSGISKMQSNAMAPAVTDLVSFFPYAENDANDIGYAKAFPFQRDILATAVDAQNIPYAGKEPKDLSDDANPANPDAKPAGKPADAPEVVDFDDDIPF